MEKLNAKHNLNSKFKLPSFGTLWSPAIGKFQNLLQKLKLKKC